eukprot:894507-Pyramimonas_sp.AAC.1
MFFRVEGVGASLGRPNPSGRLISEGRALMHSLLGAAVSLAGVGNLDPLSFQGPGPAQLAEPSALTGVVILPGAGCALQSRAGAVIA